MRISNIELDGDFQVQCINDSLVTVVNIGLIKNGTMIKEKVVVQLLRKGKLDAVYDAVARKALAISLRDKGVKEALTIEAYLYDEMLSRYAVFTA